MSPAFRGSAGRFQRGAPPSRPRGRAGITLIELLVAVVLMSMILGSVAVIFARSTRVVSSSRARVIIQQQARIILDMMERDLQGAILVNDAGGARVYFTYPTAAAGNDLTRLAAGQTVELRFVSTTGNKDATNVDLCEVLYYFDPAVKTLYRRIVTAGGASAATFTAGGIATPTTDRENDELADSVSRFILRFNDGSSDSVTAWDVPDTQPTTLPQAVRLILEFKDPQGRETERFTRDVWIPGGG